MYAVNTVLLRIWPGVQTVGGMIWFQGTGFAVLVSGSANSQPLLNWNMGWLPSEKGCWPHIPCISQYSKASSPDTPSAQFNSPLLCYKHDYKRVNKLADPKSLLACQHLRSMNVHSLAKYADAGHVLKGLLSARAYVSVLFEVSTLRSPGLSPPA